MFTPLGWHVRRCPALYIQRALGPRCAHAQADRAGVEPALNPALRPGASASLLGYPSALRRLCQARRSLFTTRASAAHDVFRDGNPSHGQRLLGVCPFHDLPRRQTSRLQHSLEHHSRHSSLRHALSSDQILAALFLNLLALYSSCVV